MGGHGPGYYYLISNGDLNRDVRDEYAHRGMRA